MALPAQHLSFLLKIPTFAWGIYSIEYGIAVILSWCQGKVTWSKYSFLTMDLNLGIRVTWSQNVGSQHLYGMLSQGGSESLILEGSRLLTLLKPLPFLGVCDTFHIFNSLFSELKPGLLIISLNQKILICKCSIWLDFDYRWILVQAPYSTQFVLSVMEW